MAMNEFLHPPRRIICHHSATATETFTWKDIKKWHLDKGWDTIGYHWGIVNDPGVSEEDKIFTKYCMELFIPFCGVDLDLADFDPMLNGKGYAIVKGRPVKYIGAHAKGFNGDSIGVCFEGNFEKNLMNYNQIILGAALCFFIMTNILRVQNSSIDEVLTGHRLLPYPTLCPGRHFPMWSLRGLLLDAINKQALTIH